MSARLLCTVVAALALTGCFGWGEKTVVKHALKCPPEKVTVEPLPFPEYEGNRYSREGIKALLDQVEAANNSRDKVIEAWKEGWEDC